MVYVFYWTKPTLLHFASVCLWKLRFFLDKAYTPPFRFFVYVEIEIFVGQCLHPTFRFFVFVQTEIFVGQNLHLYISFFVFVEIEIFFGQVYTSTFRFSFLYKRRWLLDKPH